MLAYLSILKVPIITANKNGEDIIDDIAVDKIISADIQRVFEERPTFFMHTIYKIDIHENYEWIEQAVDCRKLIINNTELEYVETSNENYTILEKYDKNTFLNELCEVTNCRNGILKHSRKDDEFFIIRDNVTYTTTNKDDRIYICSDNNVITVDSWLYSINNYGKDNTIIITDKGRLHKYMSDNGSLLNGTREDFDKGVYVINSKKGALY